MKTGVSTACMYPELLENAVKSLAMRGIGRSEIFINTNCEMEYNYILELKKIADEYGMKIDSVHPFTCAAEPMMFFTNYERRYLDILDFYKRYFEIMNVFGAEIFVFHGNKPQNPFPVKKYFERFAGLVKIAREYGVTVAQENVSRCVSGKLSFLKEMSEYLGNDAKFVLDTKQAVRAGEDTFEILDALKDKIVHVHYSDSGNNGDCLQYGEGDFDSMRLFTKLKEYGFSGTVMLELYRANYTDCQSLADNYFKLKNTLQCY